MRKQLGHQYEENDFICVFTQDLILQPLELGCGHAFEANSLRNYFNGGGNQCPTCRAPANLADMRPPAADLRGQIEAFALARPIQYPNFIQERNQAEAGIVQHEDQQMLADAQHNYEQAVEQAGLNDAAAAAEAAEAAEQGLGVNLGDDVQQDAAVGVDENEDPELLAMLEEIRLAEEQNAQQGAAGAAIAQQNDDDDPELLAALEAIRLIDENAQQGAAGAAIAQQDDDEDPDELLEAVRLSLIEDDEQEDADLGNAGAAVNHQPQPMILHGFQNAANLVAAAANQNQNIPNNVAITDMLRALRGPGRKL